MSGFLQLLRRSVVLDRLVWGRILAVLISGLVTLFASPHDGSYSMLAWICMSGWIVSLHKVSWKERVVYGLFYGNMYIVPGQYASIWNAIQMKDWSVFLSFLGIVSFFLCYVIPFLLFSIVYPWVRGASAFSSLREGLWLTVLIGWFPVYFPVYPALMIHDQPLMIQIADLGGLFLIVYVLAVVNISVARILLAFPDRHFLIRQALVVCILLGCAAGYGYVRLHQYETMKAEGRGQTIQILAVQTHIRPFEPITSLTRENSRQRFSAFEWIRHSLQRDGAADLIVFPEAPIDFTQHTRSERIMERMSGFAMRNDTPLLFSYIDQVEVEGEPRLRNHAQLMQSNGAQGAVHQKRILTPFYEYNPLESWIQSQEPTYLPGTQNVLIEVGGVSVIPALCYEIHSTRHIREFIQQGGECIAHLSNFYSFGGGVIAYYDLSMTMIYAVQYRLPVVRSTNFGYGAFIESSGSIIPGSFNPPGTRNAYSFPVFIPEMDSFYARFGDVFLYGITLLFMGDLLLLGMKRRRKMASGDVEPVSNPEA